MGLPEVTTPWKLGQRILFCGTANAPLEALATCSLWPGQQLVTTQSPRANSSCGKGKNPDSKLLQDMLNGTSRMSSGAVDFVMD